MFVALDTSTLTLSLALVERAGQRTVALEEEALGPPRKQSDMLPGAIIELLGRHRVALGALEGIAVGLGPGSFTGLRIGLATAKALAYAAELKVAGASSLAAIALAGPEGVPLFPCAVARQGELYVGSYRRAGDTVEQTAAEEAMSPEQLARLLEARQNTIALGPAIQSFGAGLRSLGVPADRLMGEPHYPSALAIAKLTTFPPERALAAIFALEPHYVRSSEAERNPAFPPQPGPPPSARILEP